MLKLGTRVESVYFFNFRIQIQAHQKLVSISIFNPKLAGTAVIDAITTFLMHFQVPKEYFVSFTINYQNFNSKMLLIEKIQRTFEKT